MKKARRVPQPRAGRDPIPGLGALTAGEMRLVDSAIRDDRPNVEVTADRHVVLSDTLEFVANDEDLYSRGDRLVKVITRTDEDDAEGRGDSKVQGLAGSPRVVPVGVDELSCRLCAVIRFYRRKKQGDDLVDVPTDPPGYLVNAIASYGEWPRVKPLVGVAETPFPRPDGTMVEAPGYDRETGVLYIPSIAFPKIPASPTQAIAERAARAILEPLSQFPFATPADRAVLLASLLTLIGRPAIEGPTPGTALIANVAGSGKGLAIDYVSIIGTGRPCPTSRYPADTDECRKTITSIALSGSPVVHLDNIPEGTTYGSGPLDSALTSTVVNDRILGRSEMTRDLPLRPVWFLSGNNTSPGKDAHRRWLPSRLESPLERPEERDDLIIADLRRHALENRARLVVAALTILRAHAMAGYPKGNWAPLGSYEAWDQVVRGAVWFATGEDCGSTRRAVADEAPERQDRLALLEAWRAIPSGSEDVSGLTADQALKIAAGTGAIAETLATALRRFGRDGQLPSPRSLGNTLRALRGVIIKGFKLEKSGEAGHTTRWRVEAVGAGSGELRDLSGTISRAQAHTRARGNQRQEHPLAPQIPSLNGHPKGDAWEGDDA